MVEPTVIPRSEHPLSRRDVDPDALKVLYRLKEAGFIAYLVGGGVRDLLLGRRPKDFDIGTSAHPYQVKRLFRNCWVIGRRFRLVHVKFGQKIIEVATFRRHVPPSEAEGDPPEPEAPGQSFGSTEAQRESAARDLLIKRDNTFGTPGGGRVPPRLHDQRPLLRYRDLFHYRLRGRVTRPPGSCHSRDRRSGRTLPRGPGPHAARGRFRRAAGLHAGSAGRGGDRAQPPGNRPERGRAPDGGVSTRSCARERAPRSSAPRRA